MIDLDDVVRDWIGALKNTYLLVHPEHNFKIKPIISWDLTKFFPIGKDIIDFALKHYVKEIYLDNAYPLRGVRSGLSYLKSRGHHITFLTAADQHTRAFTELWVKKFDLAYDKIEFVGFNTCTTKKNKTGFNGDIYIDDAIHNIRDLEKEGKTVVCMNKPWNILENLSVPRVDDFQEFVFFVDNFDILKNRGIL